MPRIPLSPDLRAAARQFEAWRRRRTQREVPPDLWELATRLARRHGVSATSRALRLGYYDIRSRVEKGAPVRNSSPRKPSFVEIVSPGPAGECMVEFEDPDGTKMRVHLRGIDVPAVEGLGRIFLRRRG